MILSFFLYKFKLSHKFKVVNGVAVRALESYAAGSGLKAQKEFKRKQQ